MIVVMVTDRRQGDGAVDKGLLHKCEESSSGPHQVLNAHS